MSRRNGFRRSRSVPQRPSSRPNRARRDWRLGLVLLGTIAAASACATKRAEGPPPMPAQPRNLLIVWASGDPDDGPAPLTVRFACDPMIADEPPSEYHWDFGDGSAPSREASPRHTYARPGMYVARVVAWDDKGHVGDDTVRIDVESPND